MRSTGKGRRGRGEAGGRPGGGKEGETGGNGGGTSDGELELAGEVEVVGDSGSSRGEEESHGRNRGE